MEIPSYDISFIYNSLENLKNRLQEINILCIFFEWSEEQNDAYYMSEIIHEKVNKILSKNHDPLRKGHIYFSDRDVREAAYSGKIYINHYMNPEVIAEFNNIFNSIFFKRTLGYIYHEDAIVLHMEKKRRLVRPKEHDTLVVKIKLSENLTLPSIKVFKIAKKFEKTHKRSVAYLFDYYSFKGEVLLFYEVYKDKIIDFSIDIKNFVYNNLLDSFEIQIYKNDIQHTMIGVWK